MTDMHPWTNAFRGAIGLSLWTLVVLMAGCSSRVAPPNLPPPEYEPPRPVDAPAAPSATEASPSAPAPVPETPTPQADPDAGVALPADDAGTEAR